MRVLIVVSQPLPRKHVRGKRNQFLRFADDSCWVIGVEFYAPNAGVRRATPVEEKPSVLIGEQHRIPRGWQPRILWQRDGSDRLKGPQRRARGVELRLRGHQQKPVAVPHHGGCVTDVAKVQRLMLPGAPLVRANPRQVTRRIQVPSSLEPECGGIGQLAVLLRAFREPQAAQFGRLAGHEITNPFAHGVVWQRKRVAVPLGGRRCFRRRRAGQ